MPVPDPTGSGCPHPTTISQNLASLATAAGQATSENIPFPNAFRTVRFSDGTRRTVLESELPLLDDCVKVAGHVPVDSSNQVFYVQTPTGGGNATLDNVLPAGAGLRPIPDFTGTQSRKSIKST